VALWACPGECCDEGHTHDGECLSSSGRIAILAALSASLAKPMPRMRWLSLGCVCGFNNEGGWELVSARMTSVGAGFIRRACERVDGSRGAVRSVQCDIQGGVSYDGAYR
jgi:hypothetical protein